MLDSFKELVAHQFEAAFRTLNACIERCPEAAWDGPVVNYKFCHVAFHTLFFADYYLGQNEATLRHQQFHRDNEAFFRDYEELQDLAPELLYDRPTTKLYLNHCRKKASDVIASESLDSLSARCEFPRRNVTRAELHVYNIRHIQHHAAQLSLRLRSDFGEDIPWFESGWSDV